RWASCLCLSWQVSRAHPLLRSFPTRRSSDLGRSGRVEPHLHLLRHARPGHRVRGDLVGSPRLLHEVPARHRQSRSTAATQDILGDRKSTRLNSSHSQTSYAVFCLKKKITVHI